MSTSSLEQKASKATLSSVGCIGSKAITGASAVTPATGYYFFALQVIADAVVSAQGNLSDAINLTLSSLTNIPAGTVIYGKFNSVTLTSGEMVGYYQQIY